MKKFLKKASIYILVMILAAGVIFSLNYYYGQRISEEIETDIAQIAEKNNYQIRYVEVESNPLLQEISLQNLNLIKADRFNLIINRAEIKLSWQQIINYIRQQDFQLDKNFVSTVEQINYSNLQDNYQLNLSNSEINYEGNIPGDILSEMSSIEDLHLLLEDNHNLVLRAGEVKYDFPYYRSYGLNNENWNRLSTFNNFIMRANYSQENRKLSIEEFNLSGDLLKIIFNLESALNYDQQNDKIIFTQLQGDYNFLLAAEGLQFEANSYFKKLNFNQFDFQGSLNLVRKKDRIQANQLDFNLNLSQFKLIMSDALSQQINQNTFGILAAENKFELLIDKFTYQQNYSYPSGSSQATLDSSLVKAELEAEYNYSGGTPYISTGSFRYKPQTSKVRQFTSFLQLVLNQRLEQNEQGYYVLEFWGEVDNLNFE